MKFYVWQAVCGRSFRETEHDSPNEALDAAFALGIDATAWVEDENGVRVSRGERYTLEAGRVICDNGNPAISIRAENVSPVAADGYARTLCALLNGRAK